MIFDNPTLNHKNVRQDLCLEAKTLKKCAWESHLGEAHAQIYLDLQNDGQFVDHSVEHLITLPTMDECLYASLR